MLKAQDVETQAPSRICSAEEFENRLLVPTISRHCVSVPFVVSHACFDLRDGLIHKLDRSYPVAALV